MLAITAASVSLLVIVAGIFLLSKTKKDGLGGAYSFVSYATVTLGILLLLGAVCAGICRMACSSCCSAGKSACGPSSCYAGHQSCGGQGAAYGCSYGKGAGFKCGPENAICGPVCSATGCCKQGGKQKQIIKKIIKKEGEEAQAAEEATESEGQK